MTRSIGLLAVILNYANSGSQVLFDWISDERFLKQLVDTQDADSFFAAWLHDEQTGQIASDLLGERGDYRKSADFPVCYSTG